MLDLLWRQIAAWNALEFWAAITGFLCIWLTVRQHIWCWPTGIISVALYAIVFHRVHLYADMGLQVVFFLLQFYGWYEWLYGGPNHTRLHVARASLRLRVVTSVLGAVSIGIMSTTLKLHTDQALPWIDSTQTVLSLIAQYMLSFKVIENWILWIVVDVLSLYMYVYTDLYLTALLYLVALILATVGYLEWRRAA